MLLSEASSCFNVMTLIWVKVVEGLSPRFRLALVTALIVTDLLLSSWVTLLVPPSPIWLIVAQRKSIGRLWKVCPRLFPFGFADGHGHELVEAVLPSRNREESGALGVDRLYAARAIVWAVPSAEQCSLLSAIAYMRPASRVNPEVTDLPPCSMGVPDVYNVDLDAMEEGYLSDIPPCGEIDVNLARGFSSHSRQVRRVLGLSTHYGRWCLQAVALCGLNTPGEQSELLAGVNWLYTSLRSFEKHIQIF